FPECLPASAVVVLHEVFGVNADMRATCDELASDGFVAICPDLFWRQQPGLDLNRWTDAEWKIGLDLNAAFDRDHGVQDVAETIQFARALDGVTGRVGVMGFCLGGLLTFLTAAREEVDAAVAYHGGDTEKYLNEVASITAPMIMHLGGRDEYIPPDAQAAIKAAVTEKDNVTVYSYPENYHAFARHSGTHYDPVAAELANGRTREFFSTHLNKPKNVAV
ncbi:MAG: dienelactone hydrolase family protein, partial [Burkholderiales bacterium]|nr:dienelactone hydrolase family protein [Phycisphaerae bacterium]